MLQVTQSFQVVWACMQNECIFFTSINPWTDCSVQSGSHGVTIRVDSYYTSSVPYFGLCVLVLFRYFALKELSGRIVSLCAVISTIIKGQTSNNHPAQCVSSITQRTNTTEWTARHFFSVKASGSRGGWIVRHYPYLKG